ncbi:HTH luxR-type domain-containing protein [Planctomycetales bacterium 10988]|nr:HTH luxR-type domain-containing protein [Planctomycetales bacterium 10988]
MKKSKRIRLKDLRAIYQLLGECREMGDDHTLWKAHWAKGVAKLVDADMIMSGGLTGWRTGRLERMEDSFWSSNPNLDLTPWFRSLELWDEGGIDYQVLLPTFAESFQGQPSITTERQRLMDDKTWYRSFEFQEIHRQLEVDNILVTIQEMQSQTNDAYHTALIARQIGKQKYGAFELNLIQLIQEETAPLIGGALASVEEPKPSDLPPRVRQVLQCILEGDGDKQIAARLEISPHTVKQYVKTLFRFFQVNSRNELMARWIKRGWGRSFQWNQNL